jgi:hypothetical protein
MNRQVGISLLEQVEEVLDRVVSRLFECAVG